MTVDPYDIPDLVAARAARESAQQTAKVRDQIDAGLEASLAAMSEAATSDKFVAFVQCAEAILPQHTVLREAWFTAAVTSLMSVYLNYVPPDKLKEFFSVLIDWMYESNCANRGGPPNYPPATQSRELVPGVSNQDSKNLIVMTRSDHIDLHRREG